MFEPLEDEELPEPDLTSNSENLSDGYWIEADEEAYRKPQTAPKSLAGFYGNKVRNQDILTPSYILNYVEACQEGSIALDPCATSDVSEHFAKENRTEGGLVLPWVDMTYVNPPFKDLKFWLAKALQEASRSGRLRITVLAPVRTRRVWFREAMRRATCVTFCNPVKFKHNKQSFPADVVLLHYNQDIAHIFEMNKTHKLGDVAIIS